MNIAICICTFKRPAGLQVVLDSFARMELDGHEIVVFVAENDLEAAEGYNFITANRASYPFKIFCEIEPGVGISYARNRTVAMIRDSGYTFDYIAFTDDDTAASSRWIADMVLASVNYKADVVCGKVESRFSVFPSAEIYTAPYFTIEAGGVSTGTRIFNGGTNNVMFAASIFQKEGWELFDVKLALSGSEDKDLFMSLEEKNYKMVFCASAVIYEIFPASRLTPEWLLRRYFRRGSTQAFLLRKRRSLMTYYSAAGKKLIRFPSQYVKYLLSPTLARKCYVYDALGFFDFMLHQKPAEEYARNPANLPPLILEVPAQPDVVDVDGMIAK